jgi:iron complex transport system ATP-binding protein
MVKVEIIKACLGYGRKTVLKDIELQVSPGEIVGLIGPNGSGKSTIIKALSRVIPLYTGKILLNGEDITRIPRMELARMVGVVPQIPLLPSTFTAFEIVLMGRNPHLGLFQYEGPEEMSIAWRAMEKTGTSALAERLVGELSGGEIQCLLIARAMAQETEVILLDEPTANLDIGRQAEILDMIRNLCAENKLTVLAALHDLNLAAQYCHQLLLIKNGQIYAKGTPNEVITSRNIKDVYGADNCIYTHPLNDLPTVLLSADHNKPGNKKRENT